MLGLGTGELIAIVLVIFLLFGATRLPQLAKSLGQSRKAFKDGMREAEEDEKGEQEKIAPKSAAPLFSQLSDEDIEAELKRREAEKKPI